MYVVRFDVKFGPILQRQWLSVVICCWIYNGAASSADSKKKPKIFVSINHAAICSVSRSFMQRSVWAIFWTLCAPWDRSVAHKWAERPVTRFIKTGFDLRDSLLPNFGISTIVFSPRASSRLGWSPLLNSSSPSHPSCSWSCRSAQQLLQIWSDYSTPVVIENRKPVENLLLRQWNWSLQNLVDIPCAELNGISFFIDSSFPWLSNGAERLVNKAVVFPLWIFGEKMSHSPWNTLISLTKIHPFHCLLLGLRRVAND